MFSWIEFKNTWKSYFSGNNKQSKEPDDEADQTAQQSAEYETSVKIKVDARSIILVGTYYPANPNFAAVVKYDLNKLTKDNMPEFECVARLNPGVGIDHGIKSTKQYNLHKLTKNKIPKNLDIDSNRIVWKACLLRSTALCLIPVYLHNIFDTSETQKEIPLNAYICDIETLQDMKTFEVPEATRFSGLVFCIEEIIYAMAYPFWTNIVPSPSFQRYNLKKKNGSWESLTPFEWDGISDEKILGYAVFKRFVLINVNTSGLWAYLVESDKWYEVKFDKQTTHSFQGLGITVEAEEKTIFALKECEYDSILLKLSVKMEENDGVILFTASLQLEFALPNRYCSFEARDWDKDVLVHLGELEFCLVRNGLLGEGYDFQLLQLVIFTVKEEKVTVSDILEHRVEISDYSPFEPVFGFSLPAFHSKQIKDKQKGGLGFEITLDPLRTLRGSEVLSNQWHV